MSGESSSNRGNGETTGQGRSSCLEDLPWTEAGRILARDPRLILPVGALIQHGPHLPLGSNTTITSAVARSASDSSGVLLAPTLHFGVKRAGKEKFAGSAGLQRKTLHRAVNELLAQWEDHGVREFLILTAHQFEPHLEALLMAMTSTATTSVINLLTIDVADILDQPLREERGGELETSLMLYLAPSSVRMEQAADVPFDLPAEGSRRRGSSPGPTTGSRGTLGFPSRASAEKGAAIFRRYVDTLLGILLHSDRDRRDPGAEP